MTEDKQEELRQIREEVTALESSPLVDYRKENDYIPVIGEGSQDAKIMFVGEAPGEKEAKTGKPFIGRAGKILDDLFDKADIKREEVYITSIVKDRPPKNRDPKPEEIALYAPFLDRQIEAIRPAVVATLGRFSMEYIMKRYGLESELAPIGELHGKVFTADIPWPASRRPWDASRGGGYKINIVPLYHPAAAIYNQKLKETLVEDFKVLKELC